MAVQPQPFIYRPTYQGIPIEEATTSLERGANRFDTNMQNFDKVMQYASTIKALPGDQEHLSALFKNANEQIKYLSGETKNSGRWDLGTNIVNSISAKFLADPQVTAIRESYKNFEKEQELRQQLSLKGGTPISFSDFSKHKSVNPDGSINIYQPDVQAKGDYVKEAVDIWKLVEPRIYNAGLSRTEFAGILEGKTIKGISPAMVNDALSKVKSTYYSTDSKIQQERLMRSQGIENPNEDIDKFLLGVGMLRVGESEVVSYTPDKEWELSARTNEMLKQAAFKAAIKKQTGRPNYDDRSHQWFNNLKTTWQTKGDVQNVVNVIGIKNTDVSKGLSYLQAAPNADEYDFVGLDSKVKKLNNNKKDITITSTPKVTGIIPTFVKGSEYLGGYYATVTYREGDSGKEESANIIIKNKDTGLRNKVETLATVEDVLTKKPDPKGYIAKDPSGLLNSSQDKINTIARENNLLGPGMQLAFRVIPESYGKGTVIPVLYNASGKYKNLSEADLDYLDLKPSYTPDLIHSMTYDLLVSDFSSYIQTKKSSQDFANSIED